MNLFFSNKERRKNWNHFLKSSANSHVYIFEINVINLEEMQKSVRIRSYFGPHFPAFGLNTERFSPNAGKCVLQNNSEYGSVGELFGDYSPGKIDLHVQVSHLKWSFLRKYLTGERAPSYLHCPQISLVLVQQLFAICGYLRPQRDLGKIYAKRVVKEEKKTRSWSHFP